jgi:hypothetical protein
MPETMSCGFRFFNSVANHPALRHNISKYQGISEGMA